MAKTKVAKATMKKRGGWKSKRKSGYKTLSLARTLNPVAQRAIAKHKYAQSFSISTSGTPTGLYQFNLNSMFDPDRSGVGHQPYGRDQYATLYNRYRVISCSYRISAIDSLNNQAIQVTAIPTNTVSVSYPDNATAREQPRARYVIQNPGSPARMLVGRSYLPSLMGRTKAQYMADDNYQAQTGTNPAEFGILNVLVGNVGDQSIPLTAICTIELVYTVEWFDVITLPSS